jgi:hypothetical protein
VVSLPPRYHDYHNKMILKVPMNFQSCVRKWSRNAFFESLNEIRPAKELWHTRKIERYRSTGRDYALRPTKSRKVFGKECREVAIPRLPFI